MSDDLVKRLRDRVSVYTQGNGHTPNGDVIRRLMGDRAEAAAALIAKDAEIARLRESNEAVTWALLDLRHVDPYGPQVHYLFGRPLSEIARILKEHEDAQQKRDG